MQSDTHLLRQTVTAILPMVCILASAGQAALALDESPARPGEWGYHPADGAVSAVNPPSFTWRPQPGMTWQIECKGDGKSTNFVYKADNIEFNVHCPPRTFPPGLYTWRYRGKDSSGRYTRWSRPRTFRIPDQAVAMPLPGRAELLARIPKQHPRLFLRPEQLPQLRQLAKTTLKPQFDRLLKQCRRILAQPPSTEEPPKYPADIVRGSDPWREIWWGNRKRVIAALNSAATLAFTRLIGGPDEFGHEAKRILLECAKWDPKGSTGYRYNDEAGMPYAYYFARTYTFVNDLLNEEEKQLCRRVMEIRGEEMYHHLCPRHLWRPYSSHSNRAWHFLGEVGIAFYDEIEQAGDWVWFAANVFFNVYPVWSDDDGGWHEGSSYWYSYINRFTWWADVMREALGIDAYDKPFFSKIGYYPMYLLPPGKVGGGFGDLTAHWTAKRNVPLMTVLAAQAHNGHWQWYVERLGGPAEPEGYIGFIRGKLPPVEPVSPDTLPTSKLFAGTGQAYLNTSLTDATNGVQVVFKSSPFGTQSHGYEANNSFLLWAYGKRLLIRSGYRDHYGSEHHRNWMWSTRSVNNITINGRGQIKHSATAQGKITAFKTTDAIDIVVGEAGSAYQPPLKRFTRTIIFIKPELIIIFDRLQAPEPASYEYWLHAINKFEITDQHNIRMINDGVCCDIDFLTPQQLRFRQTNQYDPNPRPRIKLREWHLTASTATKQRKIEFVTLYRPYRIGQSLPRKAVLTDLGTGYYLRAELSDGAVHVLLPTEDRAELNVAALRSRGAVAVRLQRNGKADQFLTLGE